MHEISVERIPPGSTPSAALRTALARLLAELDPAHPPPLANLDGLLADESAQLLVARVVDGEDAYAGMLTLGFRTTLTRMVAHIDHVAVDPRHRRRGVARQLVSEALTVAASRGASRVDLTSAASRPGAADLYRGLGFVQRDTVNWRRQLI
jgi:ribosomal protein S18 acetylase RimI-like enzyme